VWFCCGYGDYHPDIVMSADSQVRPSLLILCFKCTFCHRSGEDSEERFYRKAKSSLVRKVPTVSAVNFTESIILIIYDGFVMEWHPQRDSARTPLLKLNEIQASRVQGLERLVAPKPLAAATS
jgi:hypothetical protein